MGLWILAGVADIHSRLSLFIELVIILVCISLSVRRWSSSPLSKKRNRQNREVHFLIPAKMVEMDTTPDSPVPQPDEPLLSPAAPVESTAIEQDAIYESGAPLPSPALPASTDAPNSISASPAPTAALVSLADPLPPANPAQPTEFLSTSPGGKSRTWTAKYYLPVSSSHPASSARNQLADLPESYFAPTAGELQGAFNGLEKKRMELVDRPLLTRMLREKEEEGKKKVRADRWPQVSSRFPNCVRGRQIDPV